VDFIRAMRAHAGHTEIRLYLAQDSHDLNEWRHDPTLKTQICAPWISMLFPNSWRKKWWGSKIETVLRNLEFYFCLRRAVCHAENEEMSHIYCVESCHTQLCRAVRRSNIEFSTLCVGGVTKHLPPKKMKDYRSAFETGRLSFIVETVHVQDEWNQFSKEHIHHIPTAIPFGERHSISKINARENLSLPTNRSIFLCFGTHREDKDYLTVIHAAKESKSEPYLLFVGPLISKNNPGKILKELSYTNGTLWDQYYPEEKISELFDACDAVILPYPNDYNKGSGVLLQACQHNIPIITTDGGYLANFVNQHRVGLIYTDNNPASLAGVYDHFYRLTPDELNVLQNNLSITQEIYSWKTLIKKYLKVFKVSA
jgi:glycosyltransferase involved in cell wall biosynthesis